MAGWTSTILHTSALVSLLLCWTTVSGGSVTWRRVSKPTLRTTTPSTETTTAPTKKSSVTWKRSTITRRSTAAAEHSNQQGRNDDEKLAESYEDDLDDIEIASSVQEEHLASDKLEGESEVKPLVPGSRLGFWFDSRRKKPSSLLRPGARRNSLFPTRSTTTTTQAPTTITVTPLTVIPRTLPSITASNSKSSKIRHFGNNRSTRAPISFRKRLKTTRTPKPSVVQETLTGDTKDAYSSDDKHVESKENDDKRNEDEEQKQLKENLDGHIKTKNPISSFRKRPYNGTRLSWIRKNSRTPAATAVPQQVTAVSPEENSTTQDPETHSRKTTRVEKIRTRARTTTATKQIKEFTQNGRVVSSTTAPAVKIESFGKKYASDTTEFVNKDANTSNTRKNHAKSEEYTEDDFESETDHKDSDFEQTNSTRKKSKQRTTVEPFYITRDYGKIVTAAPVTKESKTYSTRGDPDLRASKKRNRTKGTEAPKRTTTANDELSLFQTEYSVNESVEDTDLPNNVEENSSEYSSLNDTKPSKPEKYVETNNIRQNTRFDITPSPVTGPAFSTIGLDGDAYVVWSLGQGGSGWSYQKHGGEVKWSAQNSEAEGDRWSVIAGDEAESIEADLKKPWSTARNGTGTRKSEKIASEGSDQLVPPRRTKSDPHNSASHKPGPNYLNDTLLDSELRPQSLSTQDKGPLNISHSKFPLSTKYSTSVSVGGIKYLNSTNKVFSPTIDDKYKEEVERILNQYPGISNYPYTAELGDVHGNSQEISVAMKFPEFQEYVTVDPDEGEKPTTLYPLHEQQQADQFQPNDRYPTESPQKESIPAYVQFRPNESYANERPYNSVPAIAGQQPGYPSNIPSELAKAVVEDKKWHVVGAGGDEGWSLLNEDGVLEWKIHNVDGKWKVTSAEQLAKLLSPKTENTPKVAEKLAVEVQEHSKDIKPDPPKIWTLDDDYAKWRAVSSERGKPSDQSLSETSTSSQDYDYESQEYDSFPYSDDYYSNYPTHVNYNNDYGSHSAWADHGSSTSRPNLGNRYPTLSSNIEVANSREDAIESWKSLISQQGYWKLTNNPQANFDPRQDNFQNLNKNVEKQVPPHPASVHENVNTNKLSRFNKGNEKLAKEMKKDNEKQNIPSRIEPQKQANNQKRQNHESMDQNLRSVAEKTSFLTEDNSPMQKNSENYRNKQENGDRFTESRIRIRQRDHPKLDSLIQKLENIQREAKGRAVVDLAKLLRHIKGKLNNTGNRINKNTTPQPKLLERISHTPQEDNIRQANGPTHLRERQKQHPTTIKKYMHMPNERNPNYRNYLRFRNGNYQLGSHIPNHQSGYSTARKEKKGRTSEHHTRIRQSNGEIYQINQQERRQLPPRMTEQYVHAQEKSENRMPETRSRPISHSRQHDRLEYKTEGTRRGDIGVVNKRVDQQNVYFSPESGKTKHNTQEELTNTHRGMPGENGSGLLKLIREQKKQQQSYKPPANDQELSKNHQKAHQKYKTSKNSPLVTKDPDQSESSSSDEAHANLRNQNGRKNRQNGQRRKQPRRKVNRRPQHSSPIVLKGVTEVEDEESGSVRNRKIIVIDYAGAQKRKSSVDKKDLELIIRNVRHRRSGEQEE